MDPLARHWSKHTHTVPDKNTALGKLLTELRTLVNSPDAAVQNLCSSLPSSLSSTQINSSIASLILISDHLLSTSRQSREKMAKRVHKYWAAVFAWLEYFSTRIVLIQNSRPNVSQGHRNVLLYIIPTIFLHEVYIHPAYISNTMLLDKMCNFVFRNPAAFTLMTRIWLQNTTSRSFGTNSAIVMDLYMDGIHCFASDGKQAFAVIATLEEHAESICKACLDSIIHETIHLEAGFSIDIVNFIVLLKFLRMTAIASERLDTIFINYGAVRCALKCMKVIASPSKDSLMQNEKEDLLTCFDQCLAYLAHVADSGRRLFSIKQIVRGQVLNSISNAHSSKLFENPSDRAVKQVRENSNRLIQVITTSMFYHAILRAFRESYYYTDLMIPPFLEKNWESMLRWYEIMETQRMKFRENCLIPCSSKLCPCVNQCSSAQLFCSGCRYRTYCSNECQKVDWKEHRSECNDILLKRRENNSIEKLISPDPIDRSFWGAFIDTEYETKSSDITRLWRNAKLRRDHEPIKAKSQNPIDMCRIASINYQEWPPVITVRLLCEIQVDEPDIQTAEFNRTMATVRETCTTHPESQIKVLVSLPPLGSGFHVFMVKEDVV
ncbi:hypothetical protein BDP27DRAFT_1443801 [Rhodocollybia butyracea]|uniref:MYND-type domain-containing protein n=1 Tax=Rhodocollybia butyracea TaxID=206335 RepID=A0A9P5PYJ8_9AGAR|nr:hypothetical protein BDP27DRAFT_1443801 [Rhodocollybia butyracea]